MVDIFYSKNFECKKFVTEATYKKLSPVGSNPGIMYGLAKVHKPLKNGIPSFRPILSAIGTPTYALAKFLVPMLSPLTVSEFTVKDSFTFAAEITQQSGKGYMASFDVNSLFTNIPLDETVSIIMDDIETRPDGTVCGIERAEFRNLLNLATKESFFMFNGSYYKQVDGVAMGSPLGPTLANAFMCHYEKVWLDECPTEFKPTFYRRYVDDIFVTFSSQDHVKLFFNYLKSRHENISFTSCGGEQ